jgi:DNA-binding response OmpR family regulator
VLLDVSMPGMDGLEVLERVREQQLDIAVIMSTAFGSKRVAIDALRKGADDYLRKPFEPTELRAVVDRTASRLFLRRENAALQRQLVHDRVCDCVDPVDLD